MRSSTGPLTIGATPLSRRTSCGGSANSTSPSRRTANGDPGLTAEQTQKPPFRNEIGGFCVCSPFRGGRGSRLGRGIDLLEDVGELEGGLRDSAAFAAPPSPPRPRE